MFVYSAPVKEAELWRAERGLWNETRLSISARAVTWACRFQCRYRLQHARGCRMKVTRGRQRVCLSAALLAGRMKTLKNLSATRLVYSDRQHCVRLGSARVCWWLFEKLSLLHFVGFPRRILCNFVSLRVFKAPKFFSSFTFERAEPVIMLDVSNMWTRDMFRD